jgi:uncharacterized membrane protein
MSEPHDAERTLGHVLSIGTRASTALLAAGLVATLAGAGPASRALLGAGLLVLMGTPIARVAVSVLEFARGREWWFVLCTLFVLALLVGSLTFALHG